MKLAEISKRDLHQRTFTVAISTDEMRELPETMVSTIIDPRARMADRLHALGRAAGWLEAVERV